MYSSFAVPTPGVSNHVFLGSLLDYVICRGKKDWLDKNMHRLVIRRAAMLASGNDLLPPLDSNHIAETTFISCPVRMCFGSLLANGFCENLLGIKGKNKFFCLCNFYSFLASKMTTAEK